MRSFRERNPIVVGIVAVALVVVVTVGALNYNSLPFFSTGRTYSAYFEDAGGLTPQATVAVSGFAAGKVQDVELDSHGVLVTFTVANNIRLGDRTEATIQSQTLLGNKVLEIAPRGDGRLTATIPLERTTSPYQLPDALGDLTTTISGVDTNQLSESLRTLSITLQDTPPNIRAAVDGVARFAQTIDQRDGQLRSLLGNASKATTVLGDRTGQIVGLVRDTNAVLVSLRGQSAALESISGNITALANQLSGFIADNRSTLKPALDRLNGVLATLDNRKAQIQESIKGLGTYAMTFGESVSGGPFFKAYVANLLPGQFIQPFVDAAFSDLGLDPNVLLPSQRTDPQIGQPGTPALPIPYPRTGQGGAPHLTLPDAITGNPGDQACGPPGMALPGPGCYPYREPAPAAPAGGPPPGPPVAVPDPATTPPVFVPAPGEVGTVGSPATPGATP